MTDNTQHLQDSDTIVKNLLALRQELMPVSFGGDGKESIDPSIIFKINSCLFSEYPPHKVP